MIKELVYIVSNYSISRISINCVFYVEHCINHKFACIKVNYKSYNHRYLLKNGYYSIYDRIGGWRADIPKRYVYTVIKSDMT